MQTKTKKRGEAFPSLPPPQFFGRNSPVGELHLVEPNGVVGSAAVQVFLEGNVDLLRRGRARRVAAGEVVFASVDRHREKARLAGGSPVELEHDVVPRVSVGASASDAGADPMAVVGIVNVPRVGATKVALSPEDVLMGIE